MRKKFKKGQHVLLKKPLRLTVEHIEIESIKDGQFHGNIKIWGNTKEIKRQRGMFGKHNWGVVYETPETLKYINKLVKRVKKHIREEEKNEDSK